MSRLVIFSTLIGCLINTCVCWVVTDINMDMLNPSNQSLVAEKIGENEIDDNSIVGQRADFVFPGTKWCGAGHIAENYDDLGDEVEADRCCRAHDCCSDFIPGGGTKHNLTNTAFYTRLSCECDEEFHDCLKAAGTKVAKVIGIIYFNALHTKCYREDYPVIGCCKKGGWFKSKCMEYTYNKRGKKTYQWFDVQDF